MNQETFDKALELNKRLDKYKEELEWYQDFHQAWSTEKNQPKGCITIYTTPASKQLSIPEQLMIKFVSLIEDYYNKKTAAYEQEMKKL